jgi:hypothetical protein
VLGNVPRRYPLNLARLAMAILALLAACYAREDETTSLAAEAAGDAQPAPLRRLSNAEYTNSLRDLFPQVNVALPALPNDSEVLGFDNAAEAQEPSDVRVARLEVVADRYAEALTRNPEDVRALTGCDWTEPGTSNTCAARFVATQGRRIFRRPLSDAEQERLTARFQAWRDAIDFEAAARLTLSAMLQAPQFIYRPEQVNDTGRTELNAYALATRLSYFLWESTPDEELLEAAAQKRLATDSDIRVQATRMLADPKARRSLWSFHRQWLGLGRVLADEHTLRAPEVDAQWNAETQINVLKESQLLVENVLGSGGTLNDLFTTRRAWVNADLARIYGTASPSSDASSWQETQLPASERAGILTRAAFLAGLSHRGGTSPPIRGNGVLFRLFCRPVPSPPPEADLSMPTVPDGAGPKTTRALFEERTSPAACSGCHASLNGLGFGFEHYDAAGAFRTREGLLPVDASGKLVGTDIDGTFAGALELSAKLNASNELYRCATSQWLRYALARSATPSEERWIESESRAFQRSGGDVRQLMLAMVLSPSFRMQRSKEAR